jgi:hypothetical protein
MRKYDDEGGEVVKLRTVLRSKTKNVVTWREDKAEPMSL